MVVPGATMSGLMRLSVVGPMLVKYARLSKRSACDGHSTTVTKLWDCRSVVHSTSYPANWAQLAADAACLEVAAPHEPVLGVMPNSSSPVGRVADAKRTDSRCPLLRAWSSGEPELRGSDAEGMVITGGVPPAMPAVLSSRRMKPVSSVLLMSTAAASAAIAFSTCMRRVSRVSLKA